MAAIAALSWELVARYRWLSLFTACWLVLASALGLLFSALGWHRVVGVSLMLSLSGPLLFALGGLAHGWDTHLENAGSCFPVRLFTLPVSTGLLVGAPLLLGSLVLIFAWLLAALCMLRPFGIEDIPLWWPAMCGAAVLAWVQALSWFPFPLPWLRLGCFNAFLLGVLVGTCALVHHEASEVLLAGLFLTLLVLGYATALTGVSLARRGAGKSEPFQVGPAALTAVRHVPVPFVSPFRAQLWLEWKVNGWAFLFLVGLCVAGITLPSSYVAEKALQTGLPILSPWIQQAREIVGDGWLILGYMLLVPFLIACCAGPGLGKVALRLGGSVCPPFLATRAISTPEMVKAKLFAGAIAIILGWGILAVTSLVWAIGMGHLGEMTDRLVALTGSYPTALAALVGAQLLLMAFAWLWLVSGLWLGAVGRPNLAGVIGIFGLFALSGMALLVAKWRESYWPIVDAAIIAGLIIKLVAISWVGRQLLRERMVEPGRLALALAAWALFAALAIGLELSLTPLGARWVGITVLMLPLAQALAAPLALARNRTR
jgi:hypothetical protein